MAVKTIKIILLVILFVAGTVPASAKMHTFSKLTERYMLMGEDYYQKGDIPDALWTFKKVLAIDPENTDALRYMNAIEMKNKVTEPEAPRKPDKKAEKAGREKEIRLAEVNRAAEEAARLEMAAKEDKGRHEAKAKEDAERIRREEEMRLAEEKKAREESARLAKIEEDSAKNKLEEDARSKAVAEAIALQEAEGERKKQESVAEETEKVTERQAWIEKEMERRIIQKERQGAEGPEEPALKRAPREVITKSADLPGYERYFMEGLGYPINPYMGVSWGVESVEIARPIESLMDDIKQINKTINDQVIQAAIRPEFTKTYFMKLKARYKDNWPVLRFQYFNEETLHKDDVKFGIKDLDIETYAFDIYNTFYNLGELGDVTWDLWYKRVLQETDSGDAGTPETRDAYISSFSIRPNDRYEVFISNEWQYAKKTDTPWLSKYRQWETTEEIRLQFPKYKLSLTPGFKFTSQKWQPTPDTTSRQYEYYLEAGKDINKRWKYLSKLKYKSLDADTGAFLKYNVKSQSLTTENKLSYEMAKDFYVSSGLDYSTGLSLDKFDNFALLGELKLFKPGIIRVDLGTKCHYYYGFSEWLNTFYFRFHFYD